METTLKPRELKGFDLANARQHLRRYAGATLGPHVVGAVCIVNGHDGFWVHYDAQSEADGVSLILFRDVGPGWILDYVNPNDVEWVEA